MLLSGADRFRLGYDLLQVIVPNATHGGGNVSIARLPIMQHIMTIVDDQNLRLLTLPLPRIRNLLWEVLTGEWVLTWATGSRTWGVTAFLRK